jgi:hypothetical protein
MATIKIELTEPQARCALKAISNSTKTFFQRSVNGHKATDSLNPVNIEELTQIKANIETMIKLQKLITLRFEHKIDKPFPSLPDLISRKELMNWWTKELTTMTKQSLASKYYPDCHYSVLSAKRIRFIYNQIKYG